MFGDILIRKRAQFEMLICATLMITANSSITRELPGNIPYAAKLTLLQSFQQSWESSAFSAFEAVQEAFQKTLSSLMKKYFERYGNLMSIVK